MSVNSADLKEPEDIKLDLLVLSEPIKSNAPEPELKVPTLLYSEKLSGEKLDLPAVPARLDFFAKPNNSCE